MDEDLAARLRRTIQDHQLFSPGARILVAVSGGPDSIVLLHALNQLKQPWRLTLHAAHVDHGLRPESPQDAAFVQALAEQWGVPATIERRDVAAACSEHGWSLEDGARRVRYACLAEVAQRHSASHIAVAHTADDQAETVLMRLVRGTGLRGLGAMTPMRRLGKLWLVRPLLEVWREEIESYLRDHGLAAREDASNADQRFVRNRIRHELLPLLARYYNPNIKGALTQLAEQSQWDYAFLQDAAERQWKRTTGRGAPAQVALRVKLFRRQPKAIQRLLIRQAVQQLRVDGARWEFRHWVEIDRLFIEQPVGAILDLPGGVQASRDADRVVFSTTEAAQLLPPPE